MIYRLTLCNPTRETKSSQLLRTCRQIYHEALPILYGENTFHIGIPTLDVTRYCHALERAFVTSSHRRTEPPTDIRPHLKRFEIEIDYWHEPDLSLLRDDDVRPMVAHLQSVPQIDYLKIQCKLDSRNCGGIDPECWYPHDLWPYNPEEECSRMLRTWLGQLHGVKKVVIEGMHTDADAEILEKRLRRDASSDGEKSLADEYEILEKWKRGSASSSVDLSRALEAVESDDKKAFGVWMDVMTKEMKEGLKGPGDALAADLDGKTIRYNEYSVSRNCSTSQL